MRKRIILLLRYQERGDKYYKGDNPQPRRVEFASPPTFVTRKARFARTKV